MIIGISGKIGSGKDTIGKIIQYLIHCKNDDTSYDEWENLLHYGMCDYKIKKFADKLKDIVCLLIGCTREQLEDREFKEKELGEEWWKYKVTYRTFDRLSYTSYGKWFTEFYSSEKEAELCTDGNIELDENSKTIELIKLTPRLLFQLLGTECGRDIIHPNLWCNALISEYKHKIIGEYNDQGGKILELPNWIITDMRFPNELKAVKDRGGVTIRVNRPYTTVVGGNGIPATFNQNQFHPSETVLNNAEFDYVIDNDGTIEELIEKVRTILIKEGII